MMVPQFTRNFLFCEQPETATKAKDVFQFVKDFFAKQELNIPTIGSVCTGGAPAMLGEKSGFSALMKQEIPHLQGSRSTVSFIVMLCHQKPCLRN